LFFIIAQSKLVDAPGSLPVDEK